MTVAPSTAAPLPPMPALAEPALGLGKPRKIHALTSLRFFAAMMILVHHCAEPFGIGGSWMANLLLDQGVAFFFVLSGFILTYVYPTLGTPTTPGAKSTSIPRFWLARFARVWPAHMAALGLWFFLNPRALRGVTHPIALLLANIAMVHTWFPVGGQFISINSPSWSIATECGFYLLFPLLLWKLEKNWPLKLLGAFAALWLILQLYSYPMPWLGLPVGTDLGYGHPLARVLEFTVGMCTALLWRKTHLHIPRWAGTLLELAALAIAVAAVAYALPAAASLAQHLSPAAPWGAYLAHSGIVCLPFALLIFVMALDVGELARVLACWPLVLLGEISYSLYLFHYALRNYFVGHQHAFRGIPHGLTFTGFVAITLLISHLVWLLIERPARVGILRLATRKPRLLVHASACVKGGETSAGTLPPAAKKPDRLSWPGVPIVLGEVVLLVAMLAPVVYCQSFRPNIDVVSAQAAAEFAAQSPPEFRAIHIGPRHMLVGLQTHVTPEGLELDLLWTATTSQHLDQTVAIHLEDAAGKQFAQADYPQDLRHAKISSGTIWRETLVIPPGQAAKLHKIALGLYGADGNLAYIDQGPRDWDNHRLIIKIGAPETVGPVEKP